MDATKINPVGWYGERACSNDSLKIHKLKPWLQNAQNCETKSKKLNDEIDRIKVLETKTEFFVQNRMELNNREPYLKFMEMMRQKQRFLETDKYNKRECLKSKFK